MLHERVTISPPACSHGNVFLYGSFINLIFAIDEHVKIIGRQIQLAAARLNSSIQEARKFAAALRHLFPEPR